MKRLLLFVFALLVASVAPVRAQLLTDAQKDRILGAATKEAEKALVSELKAHPERTAPAAWAYRSADGKIKGDAGMALSLFARPSLLRALHGRWVSLAAFLGKETAGVGLAWELTPHREKVEGAPRRLRVWGGPVAVTPWGDAGGLSLQLGLGLGANW